MTQYERDGNFYDDGDGPESCDCDDGLVLVCPDDMCRGAGECIHGTSGYAACRNPKCDAL